MKTTFKFSTAWTHRTIVALATAGLSILSALTPAIANPFDQQEVEQNRFVVFASPSQYGVNRYRVVILEQLSNQRPCWSESGVNPTVVEPLLLQFDFAGICGRSTDANGYSIRRNSEDLRYYDIDIVRQGNDLVLIGSSPNGTRLELGRSYGIGNGPTKLFLNPDWRLTKRAYNGRTMGHIYITNGSGQTPIPVGGSSVQPGNYFPTPASLEDLGI